MKRNDMNHHEPSGSLVLVPRDFLESLAKNQKKILEQLKEMKSQNPMSDYISHWEAQRDLNISRTWLVDRRKSGELPFSRFGGKVYYKKADLQRVSDKYDKFLYDELLALYY